MHSVRDTATTALRILLNDQPTTSAKVTFAWQMAAGATLRRATECTWSADGTLTVRARTTEWAREVNRARPMIAARLRQLLGPDVVRTIVVQDDSPTPFKALSKD